MRIEIAYPAGYPVAELTDREVVELYKKQHPESDIELTVDANGIVAPFVNKQLDKPVAPQTRAERLLDEQDLAALEQDFSQTEQVQKVAPEIGVRARVATMADFPLVTGLVSV